MSEEDFKKETIDKIKELKLKAKFLGFIVIILFGISICIEVLTLTNIYF